MMAESSVTTYPFKTSNPALFRECPAEIRAWAQTEYDILLTLTGRVRILSLQQAAAIWFADDLIRTAKRRLARLCEQGLLETAFANVELLQTTRQAIVSWKPGKQDPDFERVSNLAKSRWTGVADPQQLFFVSRRTANLFASSARGLPPAIHRDHDLLLAQVYVYYRTARPAQALRWVGEDALPKAGYRQKDPDAFLIDERGFPIRVIESAGRYSSDQVESFHEYCVEYDLPYELW